MNSKSLFVNPDPNPQPNFKPTFLADIKSKASADVTSACGENIQCLYDAIQTNNTEIGISTMQIGTDNTIAATELC